MSNIKNHRRYDRFTGRTKKWHRYKEDPRGLYAYGDTPVRTYVAKRRRRRAMRHIAIIIEEEY